jgi:hypothetical protein
MDRPPSASSRSATPKDTHRPAKGGPSPRPRAKTPSQAPSANKTPQAAGAAPAKVKGQLTRPGDEVAVDLLGEALEKGLGAAPAKGEGQGGVVLSEEEKAMNGAPEGELFVVDVLPTATLPPFQDDDDVAAALGQCWASLATADPTATPWADAFDAVTALRRVLQHCPNAAGVAAAVQSPALLAGVAAAAQSLRSALARNALLAAGALLVCAAAEAPQTAWLPGGSSDLLLGCLLAARPAAKALWAAAEESLAACVAKLPPPQLALLVPRLAVVAGHKHKEVAEAAVVWAARALAALTAAADGGLSLSSRRALDLGSTLPMLLLALNGRAPGGKQASRNCLKTLQALCGEPALAAAVAALPSLSPSQRTELAQAAAGNAAEAKKSEPRRSIAELREKHAADLAQAQETKPLEMRFEQ